MLDKKGFGEIPEACMWIKHPVSTDEQSISIRRSHMYVWLLIDFASWLHHGH